MFSSKAGIFHSPRSSRSLATRRMVSKPLYLRFLGEEGKHGDRDSAVRARIVAGLKRRLELSGIVRFLGPFGIAPGRNLARAYACLLRETL